VPAATRATESSHGRSTARSWARIRSTALPRRVVASSTRCTMGSPERLPDVITRGRAASSSRSACSGVVGSIKPSSVPPAPGATERAMHESLRRGTSTIGRASESSSARSSASSTACFSASASEPTITAKGLRPRRLHRRSSETAGSLVASHASWKPPIPRMARAPPAHRICCASASADTPSARSAPSGANAESRGPQSGHVVASAWKRRSSGQAYSAAQAAHKGKSARAVRVRSQGSARTTV
jgi:hypothetical protein